MSENDTYVKYCIIILYYYTRKKETIAKINKIFI